MPRKELDPLDEQILELLVRDGRRSASQVDDIDAALADLPELVESRLSPDRRMFA